MNTKSKLALHVAIAGIVLGVLADALLRASPWGINVPVWTAAVLASVMVLSNRHHIRWDLGTLWPALLVLIFAVGFAWRDSPSVKFFDAFGMLVAIAIWSGSLEGAPLRGWALWDYLRGFLNSGTAAAIGAAALARSDITWTGETGRRRWRHARSVVLGLLIAFPLLFVFGGLLMGADAVFDQWVTRALNIDLANLLSHGALTAFFAWTVCGFLLLILGFSQPGFSEPKPPKRPGLGIVEIAVPLALIDLLFLAFVFVQIRYLFGDTSLVEQTVGLTYAEYARRGFFELVAVAALVLPLLLAADWVLAEADARSLLVYRILAALQLVLLFVIMSSALTRMQLYVGAYGLTELRLYTTAFMTWLGIVLIWFVVTVLRGWRRPFVTGAALTGFCVIAVLNILNPDALIARLNTDRALAGQVFDARYATSLSADAVPVLISALPALGLDDRCLAAVRIVERWSAPAESDWRTWNYGRARAWRSVQAASEYLAGLECPVPEAVSDTPAATQPPDTTAAPAHSD